MVGIIFIVISFILLRFSFGCPGWLWNRLSPLSRNLMFYSQQIIYWGSLVAGLVLCFIYSIKLGIITLGFFLLFYNFSISSSIFGQFKGIPILRNSLAKLIGFVLSLVGITSYFLASMKTGIISLGIILSFLVLIKIFLFIEHQVYCRRRFAVLHEQDNTRAIKNYKKGIELKPCDVAYNYRGTFKFREGLFEECIQDYTKAIELNPKFAEAYYNRAVAYYISKKYIEAASDYEKAISENPEISQRVGKFKQESQYNVQFNVKIVDDTGLILCNIGSDLYHCLAWKYYKGNHRQDAIRAFTRSMELGPRVPAELYYERGRAYCYNGEYENAINDFTKTIEITSDRDLAYLFRAYAQYLKGEYDSAIQDFTKALNIDPECSYCLDTNIMHSSPYFYRGLVYLNKNEYAMAIADLTKSIESGTDDGVVYFARGFAYHEAHKLKEAIADYTVTIDLKYDSDKPNVWVLRGTAYDERHEYDKAISDYSQAINLAPKDALIFRYRSDAYYRKGDITKAWDDWRTCNSLGGNIDGMMCRSDQMSAEIAIYPGFPI